MPLKERDMISTSDPRVCMIGHPAPAWMVNYADLMTELVCFFVVLYGLSAALSKDIQMAREQITETMKNEEIAGGVKVDKDGMIITLQEQKDNVFFESGSSDLSPRMLEILDKIGPPLKKLAQEGHEIVVEGHTDNVPIHTSVFQSNWELSSARATNVVRDLIHHQSFPAAKMGAIGYGENRPLFPNDTPEHRASNRRVVFFVKNKPLQPTDGEKKAKQEKPKPVVEQAAPAQEEAPAENLPPEEVQTDEEPAAQDAVPLPVEPAR